MASLGVRLHGVRLNLSSDHAPLLAYAREHLRGLVGPPAAEPDLDVRCLWTEGSWDPERSPFSADGPLERIGKRMLGNADELVWLDPQRMLGLQLRIQRYLRWKTAVVIAATIVGAVVFEPRLALALAALAAANIALGLWRTGPGLRRALVRGSA